MAKPLNLNDAILACNPSTSFTNSAPYTNYSKVVWNEGSPIVSQEDAEAKLAEIRAEYDALEWKRNRQKEYPDAIECVHALLDGGDTLTNLQAKRTAVKNKYSKS